MTRLLDILLSLIALVILSPLFITIALLLKFTGEGEIFFLQSRVGRNGKFFLVYKFATMLKDSPNLGTGTVTVKSDPRILPLGGFLRRSKINELPQLLNVVWGDMSLIGPRPLTLQTFSSYSKEVQRAVKTVRPGLSGIGSIIFRNEEEIMDGENSTVVFYDNVIAPYKGELESWYTEHNNVWVYLAAIFLTIWVVLIPRSALVWRVFKTLPIPPEGLSSLLNFRN